MWVEQLQKVIGKQKKADAKTLHQIPEEPTLHGQKHGGITRTLVGNGSD
jgi:hypothetical protein